MHRSISLLVAGLLVVGALAALPTAAVAHAGSNAQPALVQADGNESVTNGTANVTDDAVAPGEQLSGILGVQAAEVEGELQTRAFDLAFERAEDNVSKAEVVAREAADTDARLADLQDRREALNEARQNGSMSEGEYRARMAVLATEAETVRDLANRSATASEGLPEETLRANGIDVSAIRTLSASAADLSGGEVAEIARSIAGGPAGATSGEQGAAAGNATVTDEANEGAAVEQGEPSENATVADGATSDASVEQAERRVASSAERVKTARDRVDSTDAGENATAVLERAESRLAAAEQALADARAASEAGDADRSADLAEQAVEEAGSALGEAEAALDAVESGTDDRTATPSSSADGDSGSDSGSDADGSSDAGASTR